MNDDGGVFSGAGRFSGIDDGGTSAMLHRQLSFTPPYASGPLLDGFAAHAIPGMEHTDRGRRSHTRTVKTSTGPALVTVGFGEPGEPGEPGEGAESGEVALSMLLPDGVADSGAEIEAVVRSWLDLDTDPAPIDASLARHDLLAPMVSARPGLRVPGSADPFETAVLTVLGQQVSLGAARTFGGRLVEAFGSEAPGGFRAFPDPEVLAAVAPEELQKAVGLTGARSRTVHGLASAVAAGRVRLDLDVDPLDARASLLEVPGIGPWTADYLAVRVFADRDAYPAGDLVLRRALGVKTAGEAAALSEPWRPYRAYALFHLWTQAAYSRM